MRRSCVGTNWHAVLLGDFLLGSGLGFRVSIGTCKVAAACERGVNHLPEQAKP